MDKVTTAALEELKRQGFKAQSVSVSHLPELREDIERYFRQGLVDEKIRDSYMRFQYDAEKTLPGAQTIFIVSIHQPITRVRFAWHDRDIGADIPPTYIGKEDDARVKATLLSVLEPAGYRIARALVPVKTLAIRAGLAQYGRNNITYVSSFGSFQRLVAFFANCPCDADSWQELKVMKACERCTLCRDTCPTGCIPSDRFLIHAERCLTWLNEIEEEFPQWVQPEWHNALIGCMRCQLVCPANKIQNNIVMEGTTFTEEETGLILQKTPYEKLPEETRKKLSAIAFDYSYSVLARNLKALIARQ
ncbi:MAG: FeS-binding protein [Chloroflexi bacterium]|nr:FeS-binding protein [Chloroflexota bacterium]